MGTNYYWHLPQYGLDAQAAKEFDAHGDSKFHIGKFSYTRPQSTFSFAQQPELVELALKLLPQDKACVMDEYGCMLTPPEMLEEIKRCHLQHLALGERFS